MGLQDRGIIREGMAADLVVFNLATIRDKATFFEPHQYSEGIEYVFDNGVAGMEASIPGHVLYDLACRGHKVAISPEFHGGGQAIWIDWEKGTLAGGTEPRKDGIALGY